MNQCVLVDTHVHLDMSPLGGALSDVIQRARDAGVMQMITIGIDGESSLRAVEIALSHDAVYAAVGVHPHDAADINASTLEMLRVTAAENPGRVVAWGETGLDYAKAYSPVAVQKDIFSRQVEIACELELPLIIHAREASHDALDVLTESLTPGCSGVFHCFSGDISVAKKVLDLGFYISVTGVVTFKNAQLTRDVVRYVPSDRLLLETDAPFLSPVPFRGKPNEPARVTLVCDEVARVRGISREEVACCTTRNAQVLFGLPSL